jgi:hypothetical protein
MEFTFITQGISKELESSCRAIYEEFLKESGVACWGLTIIGSHDVPLNVVITDTNGRQKEDRITRTLNTANDVRWLLVRSHEEWGNV